MIAKNKSERNPPKLTGSTRALASKYIAEEVATGKYPRRQAIAIGISRARAASKKPTLSPKIRAIIDKHL